MSGYRNAASDEFTRALARHGLDLLARTAPPDTLQVNLGKRCNQACHHCHVDAGPARREMMTAATASRVVEVMRSSPSISSVDLTGGAPELNPNFRMLVENARSSGRAVIVRCNLTVLFEPGMEGLSAFYRDKRVHLVCSLPCYSAENVTKQRGQGVFDQSIKALKVLNQIGFGANGLQLDLVYNPVGPFLPPAQAELEDRYREELGVFGITFNRLLTITNMPIRRFADQLRRSRGEAEYKALLVDHFNPATVEGLMCRSLVSVGYDGKLYDCDFNQMLDLPVGAAEAGKHLTIWDVNDLARVTGAMIASGGHCFGCTAGSGSSCGGALA